jgi:hypothetical protein
VYDFEVDPGWHQVTFFNPDFEKTTKIGIDMAGEQVDGALGLDAKRSYHVYDFWNDRYAGRVAGSSRLEQELRPGEARMMSVREALGRPQLLSTDRHIMQGYLDVIRTEWKPGNMTLTGVSSVVGDDPYVITLAPNGYRPVEATCKDKNTKATMSIGKDGLARVTLLRPENGEVEWSITFTY